MTEVPNDLSSTNTTSSEPLIFVKLYEPSGGSEGSSFSPGGAEGCTRLDVVSVVLSCRLGTSACHLVPTQGPVTEHMVPVLPLRSILYNLGKVKSSVPSLRGRFLWISLNPKVFPT